MSVVANANRGKRQQPYKPEQFMPRWDPDARPDRRPMMSGDEMLRAARKINKRLGG